MDRYLVVNGKFVTHRYGGYVRHDAAKDEIHKRDAMIEALKAECAILAARLVDYDYHAEEKMKLRDSIIADLRSATSEAQDEIQKRDALIAELELHLAACAAGPSTLLNCPFCGHIIGRINSCKCAAGPWRKPTDEDYYTLRREVMGASLPNDKKLIGIWSDDEDLEFIATVNPPERAQTC